jgi:hypothetical protein
MIKPTLSRFCLYLCCTLIAQGVFFARLNSQTVIGGDTIDQSAILDIQDTARGVLLPRLTSVQLNAIVKPAIFTSNQNSEDWGAILGVRIMASFIFDRIVHHAYILKFKGGNPRIKDFLTYFNNSA